MYACQFDYIGVQAPNFWFIPDANQRVPLGTVISAADPYWGGAEFIYGQAAGTITASQGVTIAAGNQVTAVANTANQARPFAVAVQAMTTGQYGWFFLGGAGVPCATAASVAAGTPVGIGGVGQVGASSAGKEIENAVSAAPSATTVVKANVQTVNGSAIIVTQDYAGWFPGVAVTGTGIAGGATIASLSSDGRTVTLSAACTATGSVSATGTYTGFVLLQMDRPFCQGRIT